MTRDSPEKEPTRRGGLDLIKPRVRSLPPCVKTKSEFGTFPHALSPLNVSALSFILVQLMRTRCHAHLNFLSVDVQLSFAEVHPDGGLRSAGELSGAQPVREAGLPHRRVSDHEHLEGPTATHQGGHAAHGAGKLER